MRHDDVEFKLGRGKGVANVHIDRFSSPYDLIRTVRDRDVIPGLERNDFLDPDRDRPSKDPDWNGFSQAHELVELLEEGIRDDRLTREVSAAALNARVERKDRLRDVGMNVYGGAVSVPALLSGHPKAMFCVKRRPVRTRILNLGVEIAANWSFRKQQLEEAGQAVARTVASLEKAGYRVQVTVGCSVWDYEQSGRVIIAMSMPVKGAGEPLNYRRMLYPLTDVSFWRGVCFGWIVRNPWFSCNEGLGRETGYLFDDEQLDAYHELIYGKGARVVRLRELATMDGQRAEGMIQALLLDTEERT